MEGSISYCLAAHWFPITLNKGTTVLDIVYCLKAEMALGPNFKVFYAESHWAHILYH